MEQILSVLAGIALVGSAVGALPTLVVEWARQSTPEVVFRTGIAQPVVALTLDDGPSEATPEILDVLDDFGARATFFVIGAQVERHPELARRIVDEGHELGHHMMADEPSIRLAPDAFRARFREMDEVLDGLGGSTVFRPASGWYDRRMVAEAARLGYRTVLGSVYPFDAQLPFPGWAAGYVRRNVRPGAVIVLHDGPERGPRTARILREVLADLVARGYRIVPVSELLAVPIPSGAGVPPPGGPTGR